MATQLRHPQAAPALSTTERSAEPRRTAVVIIHGIGQQQRNQTRDTLLCHLLDPQKQPEQTAVTDSGEGCSIQLDSDVTPVVSRRVSCDSGEADFFELYWAPLMAGKASFVQLGTALIRDTLGLPAHFGSLPGDTKKRCWDIGYTLAAVTILLGVLYLSWLLFSRSADMAEAITNQRVIPLALNLQGSVSGFPVWALVGAAISVYCISQVLFQLYTICQATKSQRIGRWQSAFAGALVFLAVLWVVLAITPMSQVLLPLVLAYVVFRGLTRFIKKWIVDYLGDIQVYCTYHETDEKFEAREKVLARATELIRKLHDREEYDRILIVAHSLGTVIALDTLWRLSSRYAPLPKVKGLLTCGTALEKVQLLLRLRSVETNPIWFYGLSDNVRTNPADLDWVNLWYRSDIVANEVDATHFKDIQGEGCSQECLKEFKSPNWFWTHSNYFCDPAVIREICRLAF